jgi:hypothetical protein
VRVTRIAWATARADENLSELSARTRNAWDVQNTAVYNAVFANHTFRGGERVKVLHEESWTPPPKEGAGP